MNSTELLSRLISFPTISSDSNLELINFCANLLEAAGARLSLIKDSTGTKANLFATIGPEGIPGILLSGHTDVVPVEGQNWAFPPFSLTESGEKLYGRGTADMKGFVACAMSAALSASNRDLKVPLHLAFSYDEEIGCVGVRSMIEMMSKAPFQPKFCIVGEPTSMAVATGHKGKTACDVTCTGREAHSALAPNALNAIHLASDLVSYIRQLQNEIAEQNQDKDYDIPYSTLHVGQISGGIALNIVPNRADLKFEIRNLRQDDPKNLLASINDHAQNLVLELRDEYPEAGITIEVTNSYPHLDTPGDAEVVSFVKSLTGGNATTKVAFGTEGGLFSNELGIPTVICGPGSMAQGHKPDEYVSVEQMAKCDAMLNNLLDRLEAGF